MITRRFVPLAVAAVALAAAGAALAAPKTSHAKFWQNKSGTVACGIEIHAKSTPARNIVCSAQGLPRPKGPVGDPYVVISAHGKPKVVLINQDPFMGSKPVTVKNGELWSALEVSCLPGAHKKVTCSNKSAHGFTIGNKKYTKF